MDPNLPGNVLNSPTAQIIAKRLWPSMLFLVVTSIVMMVGMYIFNREDPASRQLAFWIWFVVQIVINAFGLYAFLADIRILTIEARTSANQPPPAVESTEQQA